MPNEPTINLVGNLTADPELRYTQAGRPVVNFTVAQTPRIQDKQTGEWRDGQPTFMRCTLWGEQAEHTANSLVKGDRAIVSGRLQQRDYETKDGEKRTAYEVAADEVGPSLKWRDVEVQRPDRTPQPQQQQAQQQQEQRRPLRAVDDREPGA